MNIANMLIYDWLMILALSYNYKESVNSDKIEFKESYILLEFLITFIEL